MFSKICKHIGYEQDTNILRKFSGKSDLRLSHFAKTWKKVEGKCSCDLVKSSKHCFEKLCRTRQLDTPFEEWHLNHLYNINSNIKACIINYIQFS